MLRMLRGRLAGIAGLAALCALAPGCSSEAPVNLRAAPSFTLNTLDGKSVSLSDYRGKVVLLHFWATWCPPCRVAIPHEVELQKKYGPQGFAVLGLSLDRNLEDLERFLSREAVNYPMLVVDDATRAAYGGVPTVPLTILIDRGGSIRKRSLGYSLEGMAALEKLISSLLDEDPAVPNRS
ncbi:MAG: TlpA family protein disulfide reductase [Deferrisomatales bacterium]